VSHRFWEVVFSFSLNSRNIFVSSLFLLWPTDCWAMCYSASNYLCIFCCCFCCWILVLLHCDQIGCRGLFQFSYICWGLLCALRYGLFWGQLHGLLRRIYIVLLQLIKYIDELFWRHQLGPFDLRCHLVLGFLCWFFWYNLSIGDRGVLKSPTTTVVGSLCAFKSFSVCLMKLSALTLGACRLIIVTSFRCSAPFIVWSYLLCLV
jgi:hypothetical protein